jgi:hypothetical protein
MIGSPSKKKVLATPNSILWEFYAILTHQADLASKASEPEQKRRMMATCIILAVTLVETFVNIYFRIVASEKQFSHAGAEIMEDLRNQMSLDYKIKKWPRLAFGASVDFGQGVGQDFISLKEDRNWLMHFSSTYEPVSFDNVTIQGLSDISRYESFDHYDPIRTVSTVEGIIIEILKLRGITSNQVAPSLLQWLGKTH